MKLPLNVKPKNFIWNLFPFSKYTAQAIYPNIYFTKDVYENLKSDKPNPRYIAALKHEQTHIERQKRTGWVKWGFSYVIFPKFRFDEELEALKSSMKYLKERKEDFDTQRSAKFLSGWLYLWCVSYKKAKLELDKAWQE
jgi:2-methylisocitrate lyase-like PEP mutase family enzyme